MPCSLSAANEIRLKPAHCICSVFPQPVLHTSVPIMKESPFGYKISLRIGNGSVQVRFLDFHLSLCPATNSTCSGKDRKVFKLVFM